MSFLHDKNVYEKIIESLLKKNAQLQEDSPTQDQVQDQGLTPGTTATKTVISAAKKLANNLKSELSGKPIENITSAKDIDLKPENLFSLQNLLKFLLDNTIKINDTQIVLEPIDLNPKSEMFSRVYNYDVDKKALIEYLNTLKTNYANNRFISGLLMNVSKQANDIIKDSKLLSGPEAKQIDQVVDSFSNKEFMENASLSTGNAAQLKLSDLSSQPKFNAWLASPPVAMVSIKQQDGSILGKGASNPDFFTPENMRILFSVLNARAEQIANANTDVSKTPLFNSYKQSVKALASQYNVQLSGTQSTQQNQPTPAQNQTPAQIMADPKKLQHLTTILGSDFPLKQGVIDLNNINTFVDTYESIFGTNNTTNLNAALTDIKNFLRSGTSISIGNNFPTTAFVSMFKGENTTSANNALTKLQQVMTDIGSLLTNLSRYTALVPNINTNHSSQEAIWRSNMGDLNQMATRITYLGHK